MDGQHETYPAKTIRDWKQRHESEMGERLSADSESLQSDVFFHPSFPTGLVDQKINDEIETLRKARSFAEFDIVRSSLTLGRRVVNGELCGGTDSVKCRALAWCARLLSRSDELVEAEKYLKLAKTLGTCVELEIADAFVTSRKGDKSGALRILEGLDTPASRSAALMIVAYHEDAEGVLDWLTNAAIDAANLDPDGKCFLLTHHLAQARWETATEVLSAITNHQDSEEAPVLHHLMAITRLLTAVPPEFRALMLDQLPFEAANFPLASDEAGINARRAAHCHFTDAVVAARQLNCPRAATADDEYALWLELRDPEKSDDGKKRLQEKLHDLKSALRVVPFALQFGIELNLAAVEQEIRRQIALNGGITEDAAIARFGLAFTQSSPEDVANYLARHYNEFGKYFDKKSIRSLQIEMLSRAGLPARANECLDVLLTEGLSGSDESRLRRIISDAEGDDPIENRKTQYKESNSLSDLASLVQELGTREDWDGVCEFGALLFERTRSVNDAERLANALNNAGRADRLVEFVEGNRNLLSQSKDLRMLYSWALFHEGALVTARSQLANLSDDPENLHYRQLQVNLGIALGDWASLSAFVANEYQTREQRSAQDLLDAGQLALCLDLPAARELVFAAVAKAGDDATVLAKAYFLASNAGWENDAEVFTWLEKAADLSADDGPLQRMTLKDLVDRKPEWDRRESRTWQLLGRAEIPMSLAAESFNRPLIGLMLFPALANLSESDPRHRNVILAYGGEHRKPTRLVTVGTTTAVDTTALLTLSFLDLLDTALDAFETVWVPHSTLSWLFEEKQKTAFHQPSRIKDAHQIRNLLATGALEKFVPSTVADSDLSAEIGDELASFIAEAEQVGNDDRQRIVVRSFPVHRLSSLMEEEVDLTEHASVLSSCLSVVDVLRQKGQITMEEEKRARTYLHLHEKPWPDQPAIEDGAVLYLDDLVMTNLLHLGLIGKLKTAGFRPIASPVEISEANEFIAFESVSSKVREAIERIRSALNSRINSGSIRVGSRHHADRKDEQSVSNDTTFGLYALAGKCDAVISDDRFFNRHEQLDGGTAQVPIFSTLDLLDALASAGAISTDDRFECRARLRRAGYFFVPVEDDELAWHLTASAVNDNQLSETAELKAIRENFLRVRMTDYLQVPREAPWLVSTFQVFIRVLKSLWKDGADLPSVRIRSNWLVGQVDVRGWAHRFGPEKGDNLAKTGQAANITMLLAPPRDAPEMVKDAYWDWLEGRVLRPIKEQFPDLYASIVDFSRRQVAEISETKLAESSDEENNNDYVRAAMARAALEFLPPSIRQSLLDEPGFRQEYDFATVSLLKIGDFAIRRSELFDAVRAALADEQTQTVTDANSREWKLRIDAATRQLPNLVLASDERLFDLPDFSVLSTDVAIRLRSLGKAASDLNLPASSRDIWHEILTERALEDDEVDRFHSELRDTPGFFAKSLPQAILAGQSSVSSLVPSSRRYFERLVGTYDGTVSIRDYAAGAGRQFLEQLKEWRPYDGFLFSLLLSSHSALTEEIAVERLEGDELVRAYDFIEKHGDMMSRLGAIEVGFRILPENPEIKPSIVRLIQQIRDDDVDASTSEFKLFAALFFLVDGELSRTRLFSTEPPFYRRLASLSQAALIHRQFVNSGVAYGSICDWAFDNRGQQFYIQSFSDMRLEPRWHPHLAAVAQIKDEFFGRIMFAANIWEANIGDSEIRDLIFGGPASLESLSEFPAPQLPGPLEGKEGGPSVLPILSDAIDAQLNTDTVEPTAFYALVNSAMIFQVSPSQAELATKVLKRGNHRLANVQDKSQLFAILNGLATVAATSRSPALADELRILMRRYRSDAQFGFTIDEELEVCLVAAASRVELAEWRDFAGDWLTELAFGKIGYDDGNVLHSHLQCLCHAVPELWLSCGKADAALMAISGR